MHYDSRVLDVLDGTPKYRTRYGGEQCGDLGEERAEAPPAFLDFFCVRKCHPPHQNGAQPNARR